MGRLRRPPPSPTLSYDKDKQVTTVSFSETIPAGSKAQLKQTFTGILNDNMAGFYRSKYTPVGEAGPGTPKEGDFHYIDEGEGEVLLLLHGSGQLRVRAGMHYIAINLAASLLFLIGVSLIYGVTGTLNMAHLANLVSSMPGEDRPLLHAGVAILAVAFLVKAGSWPLNFWLPTAYMAAAAPVGAMFAIMTKVGVYAILRLAMLLFGETGGASAGFGASILIVLGMITVLFGLLGILASQGLGRMAAHSVLISSGTVLGITGFALAGGGQAMLAGALYYMVGSVLATGALFLLIEPMNREDGGIAAMLEGSTEASTVNAVFRAVHSIKGAARIVNFAVRTDFQGEWGGTYLFRSALTACLTTQYYERLWHRRAGHGGNERVRRRLQHSWLAVRGCGSGGGSGSCQCRRWPRCASVAAAGRSL